MLKIGAWEESWATCLSGAQETGVADPVVCLKLCVGWNVSIAIIACSTTGIVVLVGGPQDGVGAALSEADTIDGVPGEAS